jgi:hypothetical protein
MNQNIIDLATNSNLYNTRLDESNKDNLYENHIVSKNFLINSFNELNDNKINLNTYLNKINFDTKFDLFFVSVGCAPYFMETEVLIKERINTEDDQMMPPAIRDLMRSNKSIQIFCIDDMFSTKTNIYFQEQRKMELVKNASDRFDINYFFEDNIHKWRFTKGSQIIEVILLNYEFHTEGVYLPRHFTKKSNEEFVNRLINFCVDNKKMYIQQCFAGRNDDLFSWFKTLYSNFTGDKEIFKQKILFDMSYGREGSGCKTDLNKYKPIYDTTGENFINYGLFTISELQTVYNNKFGIDYVFKTTNKLYKTQELINAILA